MKPSGWIPCSGHGGGCECPSPGLLMLALGACQPSLILPKCWPPRGSSQPRNHTVLPERPPFLEGRAVFSYNHQVGHESWGPGWGADTPNGLFLPYKPSVTLPYQRHCPSTPSLFRETQLHAFHASSAGACPTILPFCLPEECKVLTPKATVSYTRLMVSRTIWTKDLTYYSTSLSFHGSRFTYE